MKDRIIKSLAGKNWVTQAQLARDLNVSPYLLKREIEELERQGIVGSDTPGEKGVMTVYKLIRPIAAMSILPIKRRGKKTDPNRAGLGLRGRSRIEAIKRAILEKLEDGDPLGVLQRKIGGKGSISAALKAKHKTRGGLQPALIELKSEGLISWEKLSRRKVIFYKHQLKQAEEVTLNACQTPEKALEVLLMAVRSEAQKSIKAVPENYVNAACEGYVKLIKNLEERIKDKEASWVKKLLNFSSTQ